MLVGRRVVVGAVIHFAVAYLKSGRGKVAIFRGNYNYHIFQVPTFNRKGQNMNSNEQTVAEKIYENEFISRFKHRD